MFKYLINIIKKNKGSEFFLIKFVVIPIYGIIFSLFIIIILSPAVFSRYFKLYINYNYEFEQLPLVKSTVFSNSLVQEDEVEIFLKKLNCFENLDSRYMIQKYSCSPKNEQIIQIIVKDFPSDINLSFPTYYELALKQKYNINQFFQNKYKESIAFKSEIAEILRLPEVKFLTGSNQIYLLNDDESNIEIFSIFYVYGKLYLFNYIPIKKDMNESIKLINLIETL
ncbi:hypothetical protein [Leptospira yanagawae]|nr:hypothetical protein [Leptospira yanagawae]